jgi:energy-converting hydrogenase Eha subunit C
MQTLDKLQLFGLSMLWLVMTRVLCLPVLDVAAASSHLEKIVELLIALLQKPLRY